MLHERLGGLIRRGGRPAAGAPRMPDGNNDQLRHLPKEELELVARELERVAVETDRAAQQAAKALEAARRHDQHQAGIVAAVQRAADLMRADLTASQHRSSELAALVSRLRAEAEAAYGKAITARLAADDALEREARPEPSRAAATEKAPRGDKAGPVSRGNANTRASGSPPSGAPGPTELPVVAWSQRDWDWSKLLAAALDGEDGERDDDSSSTDAAENGPADGLGGLVGGRRTIVRPGRAAMTLNTGNSGIRPAAGDQAPEP